ncbi:MAG: hypothetical protein ACE5L6_05205 [Candidatus Bathyarchaeia archaeon]
MSSRNVKNALLIFIRAVALAAGLGLLVSGIGDLGLLIGQGLWLGLSRGGFAVFKIVIGAFLIVASIKPDVAYPRMEKRE